MTEMCWVVRCLAFTARLIVPLNVTFGVTNRHPKELRLGSRLHYFVAFFALSTVCCNNLTKCHSMIRPSAFGCILPLLIACIIDLSPFHIVGFDTLNNLWPQLVERKVFYNIIRYILKKRTMHQRVPHSGCFFNYRLQAGPVGRFFCFIL